MATMSILSKLSDTPPDRSRVVLHICVRSCMCGLSVSCIQYVYCNNKTVYLIPALSLQVHHVYSAIYMYVFLSTVNLH